MLEHCRAFESEVSERPEFFVDLINRIIKDKQIHPDYVIYGLSGLVKAKYNPALVCKFSEDIVKLKLSDELIRLLFGISTISVKVSP